MFKAGEIVRRAGGDELGIVRSSFSSIGPRRYRVQWDSGMTSLCRPTDIRCVKKGKWERR